MCLATSGGVCSCIGRVLSQKPVAAEPVKTLCEAHELFRKHLEKSSKHVQLFRVSMPEPSLNLARDLGPQPRRQNREGCVCVWGMGVSGVSAGDSDGDGGCSGEM